jgi:hypothetical protein
MSSCGDRQDDFGELEMGSNDMLEDTPNEFGRHVCLGLEMVSPRHVSCTNST